MTNQHQQVAAMTNTSNLAQQIVAYGQTTAARSYWGCAIHHLPPAGLRALAARMGGDTMGDSLRRQLLTLDMERETQPFALGPK